jgi:transporter family protein
MKALLGYWQFWAILSASFAALTAVFAKVGIAQVNSDLHSDHRHPGSIGRDPDRHRTVAAAVIDSGRSYLFLVLSGLATGGSWVCYFRALKLGDAARVAPIDKLSVVLVAVFGVTLPRRTPQRGKLARRGPHRRLVQFSSPIRADRYGRYEGCPRLSA